MRSIFVKILVWFCITLVVCVAGGELSARFRRFAPGRRDFFSRALAFQVDGARHAYETGGAPSLQDYFARLQRHFPGRYALLDANGRDVVTGADRSTQLKQAWPPRRWTGPAPRVIVWPSGDKKYWVLIQAAIPGTPPSPIPYYLWLVLAALVFSYVLAVYFGSPLRALEQAVERFGRGDLMVRAPVNRKDEFGELANAFNVMADRIQMLLTAERRLLQDVSHELRSPLARLEFAVELARTSNDRGKALDRIRKEVDRLGMLVSELLQVTRAESDPQSRNFEDISLTDLVRDVVDDSAVEAEARRCRLSFESVEPVLVRGDRELVRRAVENVLRNAIRYAPAGTAVEIGIARREDKALLSIRDFGSGVPEEHLSSLFKPFFRAEADRNRNNGGGVGLGLSIAQRAVLLHDGEIRARNAQPGLSVEIELPLAAAAVPTSGVAL
ncbi:MAG: HAMP domain-containing histidine kinase [Acidobacteriaceae bacterium]|nr:HAMP domain-containing histidine kinase [Acidobacteriaceae bacterium]